MRPTVRPEDDRSVSLRAVLAFMVLYVRYFFERKTVPALPPAPRPRQPVRRMPRNVRPHPQAFYLGTLVNCVARLGRLRKLDAPGPIIEREMELIHAKSSRLKPEEALAVLWSWKALAPYCKLHLWSSENGVFLHLLPEDEAEIP